jgi:hypothetical protein
LKERYIINYGVCISASRPDRIKTGTLWIGLSNDKNGVYPTTQLLHGVARVYINMKELDIINYGNCISASRSTRITPGTLWIRSSNDKNGVYPTTKLEHGVALFSLKMKEFEKLIVKIVSQLHAPTALPPVLFG